MLTGVVASISLARQKTSSKGDMSSRCLMTSSWKSSDAAGSRTVGRRERAKEPEEPRVRLECGQHLTTEDLLRAQQAVAHRRACRYRMSVPGGQRSTC